MNLKALLSKKGLSIPTVPPDLPMVDAIRRMTETRSRALLVVESGEPAGILTEGDILQAYLNCSGEGFATVRVADAMTAGAVVAEAAEDIGFGLDTLLRSGIGCLPVVEDGRIAGVLFLRDLLQHRVEELMDEIAMLHEYVASLQEAILD
ncbi:MAG: cyclic nucleotide-binding/CBS domain-containing protein [Syntrophobacteraceae bacterium]